MNRSLAAGIAVILAGSGIAWGAAAAPAEAPRAAAAAAAPTDVVAAAAGPTTAATASTETSATGTPACRRQVSSTHPIERLAGPNRFATATCTSQVGFPDGATTVVLARGDDAGGYADALAGTVLAHAVGGPVLLTAPDVLPPDTSAELRRLGATDVVVLGGPNAISDAVVRDVAALGIRTERISGADRAATAAAIAARAGTRGRAFVVNGYRPADALVAGAAAARAGAALLLATPDGVPQVTLDALRGASDVTVVGGFAVLDEGAEAQLRKAIGGEVERLAGAGRDETAAAVARRYPGDGRVTLVGSSDRNLVDAISASWLAARPGGGPVLYAQTDRPGHGTDRWLRLGGLAGGPTTWIVGGEAVVGPKVVDTLAARYAEAARGGPAPQTRAAWIHLFDNTLKSRSGIERMLDAATAANLNTVIVQVSRRQDAYYTSDVLPRTSDPRMPAGLDLLERLVPAAHARGIEVHAWFAVSQAYHSTAYPDPKALPADHVWRRHGPGSADPWITEPHPDRRADLGYPGSYTRYPYLDLGVPAVRDHVTASVVEVARRYEVDAIHLDYIRYPGKQWGYHPEALARFRAERGRAASYVPAISDREWSDWRREQVTSLVRRIRSEVQAASPGTEISAAVIAQQDGPSGVGGFHNTIAYADKMQDWRSWVLDGLVDRAYPMAYFDQRRYPGWYDQWVSFAATLPRERVAIGQGSWLNTITDSTTQARKALDRSGGIVLYSYQQDSATEPHLRLWQRLGSGLLSDPAPAP